MFVNIVIYVVKLFLEIPLLQLNRLRILWFSLLLALPALAMSAEPITSQPETPAIQVVNGYLVVHLPSENVTVVGQPVSEAAVDTGWATWAQKGQLLWRGEMKDSQGRLYNVRILPGYVAPWNFAVEGWSDAGHDLSEYGQADTWNTMGRHMKNTFKWGWKTSFWEFGLKGSKDAWAENFDKASLRTSRKTFGWPLAYPWAFVASAFESALRVPLGAAGAVIGTAVAGVAIPVVETAWPSFKATWHASVNGVILPVAGWSWQTVAALPTVLLASAPTPARADGTWMKLVEPPKPVMESPVVGPVTEPILADLTRYAAQAAVLDADVATSLVGLQRREREEMEALRAKYAAEAKAVQAARSQKFLDWANLSENHDAIERLAKDGGDAATIRKASAALVARLAATGVPEAEAKAVVDRLASHPLMYRRPVVAARYDKTDPLRGAIDTVKHVDREADKAGL